MTIPVHPDHDGDCTADLRKALSNAPTEAVAIDLAEVPYLSSAALTELVRFRKSRAGERVVLLHVNALIQRTLNIVGFNKLFTIDAPAA